jgi:ATP-dependent Lon protease
MLRFPDGRVRILIQGVSRFRLFEFRQLKPYARGRIAVVEDRTRRTIELEAMVRTVTERFQQAVALAPYLPDELKTTVMNIENPGKLADLISVNLNLETSQRQDLLETFDARDRLAKLIPLLTRELSVLEMGEKISAAVKAQMDKDSREYYLREQIKVIQKELGEYDEKAREIGVLQERINQAQLPPEPLKAAQSELDRLARMSPLAAEYSVCRTYLDWLVSLPWKAAVEDNLDLTEAERILNEDHFDLEKVKARILEFLAVRKLKGEAKGPILCFVGPPGVGKTSLGMSIARAMGRRFTRISLGGVRDEAEIRGFRRTYVGSLPGRILQGLRTCGSNNPIFMLDEVDKIGQDFRGDPAAALLEVLDPEQNSTFVDHYLDVPFDLSRVMFITTANLLDPVPAALRDRMEVLELPGYIEEDKLQIAKRFLIPRQLSANGLSPANATLLDQAVLRVIREYTKEAGVRNLERELAGILRKIAKRVACGMSDQVVVSSERVPEFLGPPRFFSEVADRSGGVGVVTGVVCTPWGGDIQFVEATKMRGRKGLILTGSLGDVLRESAQAALSYVRSRGEALGIDAGFFEHCDIHIHLPAGAIPKDGPSAGVTMATALASLLSGLAVKPFVAMTGEITLRGKVLPVGGIKEKVIAARRAGIRTMIIPRQNEKDLEEIPPQLKDKVDFVLVDKMDDVIASALENNGETKRHMSSQRFQSFRAAFPSPARQFSPSSSPTGAKPDGTARRKVAGGVKR